MRASLHHVHIFASDIDATVAWWRDMLGGEVVYDGTFGGARNVFMKVGSGGLNIYDQPPRGVTLGPVHHLGIRCDDLAATVDHLRASGVEFRGEIREFGAWRYIMCTAPDNILLELFAADDDLQPPAVATYLKS
jgi:catechol 2,3-dioxygenase-like lactoylglutathione lyase family enzyme